MKTNHYFNLTLLLLMLVVACHEKETVLKPALIILQSTDQIVPLQDSMVQPILYQDIPGLKHLPLKETKEKFIAIVLPAILIAKHNQAIHRKKISLLIEKERWSADDSIMFSYQQHRFKADNIQDLLNRMDTHPNSIILAQAAVESGWGSSRFFREGNNLFGIWAYKADEPRIAANDGNVYLRRYDDISQSIEDYFATLGRAKPYRAFRKARTEGKGVDGLLPYLKYYSERGKAYTDQLKVIINQNDLTQYDDYQIDPSYFFQE